MKELLLGAFAVAVCALFGLLNRRADRATARRLLELYRSGQGSGR